MGPARVLAVRMTYVGELGWELHVTTNQALGLYDAIRNSGRDLGLVDAGHYAINSLRLEKGFRAWGAELSPDDTPWEAGLGFAVSLSKGVEFTGRAALEQQKQTGWRRQLVTLVLSDPDPVLWGAEPILRNGHPVGYTTSGSYGHTLGSAVGMGYVKHSEIITADFVRNGSYEVDVNGSRVAAKAFLRPPLDPERARILC